MGATAALLAGGLNPPPAQAISLGLGDVGCLAGDPLPELPNPAGAPDCSKATPSMIATAADALLGALVPGIGLKLSDLNGAAALAGSAVIEGSGFSTAVGVLSNSKAKADYIASLAVALGVTGDATAESTFGAALATTLGIGGTTNAKAMPLGIAIANVAPDGLSTLDASATALGGIAMASRIEGGDSTVACTALYGSASVKVNGEHDKSCTSVLFIFQKSQNGADPVVYAIKNPFDLKFVSPYGTTLAELLGGMGTALGIPTEIADLTSVNFIPQFGSDIIRISFENGVPKMGTDVPQWLGGLLGSANTSSKTSSSALASGKSGDAGTTVEHPASVAADVAADDQSQVNESATVDTVHDDAPTQDDQVEPVVTHPGDVAEENEAGADHSASDPAPSDSDSGDGQSAVDGGSEADGDPAVDSGQTDDAASSNDGESVVS